jgi:flagellar biosynthesis/type III secretory pathway M-ring protein FliF/YscJ
MGKKEKQSPEAKEQRDERMEKVRTLTTGQSENAAKVLKMWLEKSSEKK